MAPCGLVGRYNRPEDHTASIFTAEHQRHLHRCENLKSIEAQLSHSITITSAFLRFPKANSNPVNCL
jgi:hypothetical protein